MFLNMFLVLGLVAYFCNPSTWNVEAGGSRIQTFLSFL